MIYVKLIFERNGEGDILTIKIEERMFRIFIRITKQMRG